MKNVWWYAAGVASIGIVIGSFVALSKSPVVAVVIPLMFGLIAGTSGLYLTREDLTQKTGRDRLGFLGICLFSLAFFTFLSCGILLWLERPQLTPNIMNIPGFENLASNEVVRLTEIRSVAVLLGSSVDERKSILEKAAKEMLRAKIAVSSIDDQTTILKKLKSVSLCLLSLKQQAEKQNFESVPNDLSGQITELRLLTTYAIQSILAYQNKDGSSPGASAIAELMSEIRSDANRIVVSDDKVEALSKFPDFLSAIYKVKFVLDWNVLSISAKPIESVSRSDWDFHSESQNYPIELLKILAGMPAKSGTEFNNAAGSLAALPPKPQEDFKDGGLF